MATSERNNADVAPFLEDTRDVLLLNDDERTSASSCSIVHDARFLAQQKQRHIEVIRSLRLPVTHSCC